jgi:Ca2+-binding EF-hand superfamily protein
MNATLKAEDAVPARNDSEARMHMQVLDKMLAKRKSVRDIFVKMDRDSDGCVSASNLREQ